MNQNKPLIQRSEDRQGYWRRVCWWTVLGLLLWFGVTFGISWGSQVMDQWHVGRMPAGYWWATQGAIGVYLFIVVAHSWLMDRLEQEQTPSQVDLPGEHD